MSERKTGVILSYVQVVISVIINIIYVPVLLHYLGKNEYGLYQLVGSFFAYITVFESSINVGVLKNYCRALDLHDEKQQEQTLYAAKRIYRYLAYFVVAVGFIFLFIFRIIYQNSLSDIELGEGTLIIGILFVNLVITLSGSTYLTILTGKEKFIFIKLLNIIIQVIQPFAVVLIIQRIPYAICIVLIITILNFVSVMSRNLYVIHKLEIKIRRCIISKNIVKEILNLASIILLASIADQIFWKADQLILGKIFGTSMVAVYAVGSQICNLYYMFGTQMTGVYYPYVSSLYYEENGLEKVSDAFTRLGRIVSFVLMLILSGFFVFGMEFLHIWVGNGYDEAYYVALVIMIPFSIDLVQSIGLSILQISGNYSFRAKMYLIAALANIISTIFFSVWWGIIGAAISTGITMFITSGLIMNYYYKNKVGINIKKFWKECLPIVYIAASFSICVFLLKKYFVKPTNSIIILILEIICYFIFYIGLMFFVMKDDEKKKLYSILNKLRARVTDNQ